MNANKIHILLNDVKEIATDYLKHFRGKRKSQDVTEYVITILSNICDKKLVKKYMYFEIVEQLVCQVIPYINNTYHFKLTENSIDKQVKRVIELKNKPQPEQRTEEWYVFRQGRFGASEVSSIFNKNPDTRGIFEKTPDTRGILCIKIYFVEIYVQNTYVYT